MTKTESEPRESRRSRRWLWLLGALAAIAGSLAIVAVLAFTLLDEEWLKEQLVAKAREMFEIDLEIDSLQFQPWQGKADLSGVAFKIDKPDRHIHGRIESIQAELEIWSLLFRKIDVRTLNVVGPHATFVLDRPPESERRPTFGELAEKVVDVLDNLLLRILKAFFGTLQPKQGCQVRIGQLEVVDGELECAILRPGVEPVKIVFDNIACEASDLRPGQPGFGAWGYIAHADISADLLMGDTRVGLQHQFASLPRTIQVSGLDLGEMDRLGSRQDAIVFEGGTLDLAYQDRGDRFEVEANFTAMKLEKNDEADLPDILFVPVDHLIAYVEENDGNLALRFSRDRQETVLSDDLEFLVAEAWKGMWTELLKRFQGEAAKKLDDWKTKGTEKLRNFLRNKDLLDEGDAGP